jgi:hypothetical protein
MGRRKEDGRSESDLRLSVILCVVGRHGGSGTDPDEHGHSKELGGSATSEVGGAVVNYCLFADDRRFGLGFRLRRDKRNKRTHGEELPSDVQVHVFI